MRDTNLLVVCGPTASGKTSLAVALAAQCNGEIISADSRQVYRKLDIGSGKDLHEYTTGAQSVPYHLIDITAPSTVYTLYHFQRDFWTCFNDVTSRGNLPVLCGGSGLYIEAILRNYQIPAVPENSTLRKSLIVRPANELKTMLFTLDETRYNHTDLSSKKRIVRAIEVATAIKQTPQRATDAPLPPLSPLILCTRWNRTTLHERIAQRLESRFNEGMIDEVKHLRNTGLSDDRLLMLGMEYKFITRYLRGEMHLPEMKQALQHSIFQLAKRQETYFRGMERRCATTIHWIDNADITAAYEAARKLFPCGR